MVDVASPTSTITNAIDDLDGQFLAIGGVALGIAASLFALKRGWQVAKSFIK